MNVFDLVIADKATVLLAEIFLDNESRSQITDLIKEHRHIAALHEYGLPVNNKVLLSGSSGCGKTTTAKAIANALGRPIVILNLSTVICSRIGETSQNIKQVFDKAARDKAVLFLDEFDQIGKARGGDDNDVGEMRRLVNTLIQLIDYFPEKALLICATNHAAILDSALVRRFQLHISYTLPARQVLDGYYDKLLSPFPQWVKDIPRKYGISYAEARDHAYTHVKRQLIRELEAMETPACGAAVSETPA